MFISHESVAKRQAVGFKELLDKASSDIEFFLTSDWYSLESGEPWFTPLVEQLRTCDELLAIITRPEGFRTSRLEPPLAVESCRRFSSLVVCLGKRFRIQSPAFN